MEQANPPSVLCNFSRNSNNGDLSICLLTGSLHFTLRSGKAVFRSAKGSRAARSCTASRSLWMIRHQCWAWKLLYSQRVVSTWKMPLSGSSHRVLLSVSTLWIAKQSSSPAHSWSIAAPSSHKSACIFGSLLSDVSLPLFPPYLPLFFLGKEVILSVWKCLHDGGTMDPTLLQLSLGTPHICDIHLCALGTSFVCYGF